MSHRIIFQKGVKEVDQRRTFNLPHLIIDEESISSNLSSSRWVRLGKGKVGKK